MDIYEFVKGFKTHPVLFIGSGISMRYLENSFTWELLLKELALGVNTDPNYYWDIKARSRGTDKSIFSFPKIASILEEDFDTYGSQRTDGLWGDVNSLFYKELADGKSPSRLKIYISFLLKDLNYREEMSEELALFRSIRKNIGSVITTNYDLLVEDIFMFTPLIGNNILLSNTYGSVYKIHGSVERSEEIVITESDYEKFEAKYELIKAQLLSLFIHNPIIFFGYSITDSNIRKLLETIYRYVDVNSSLSEKIRKNFLLVEYKTEESNVIIDKHDIDISGNIIRINKVQTNNFIEIYKALGAIRLPISAMDIRKVQNIVADIYKGGENSIKVRITEDLEQLQNSDKVLVIGSDKTIRYDFLTIGEMICDYFQIIEEKNDQILESIDKQRINNSQYFPIYKFSQLNPNLNRIEELKKNQEQKIRELKKRFSEKNFPTYSSIDAILKQDDADSKKVNIILWNVLMGNIDLNDLYNYILQLKKTVARTELLRSTPYKQLVCVYDYMKYSTPVE